MRIMVRLIKTAITGVCACLIIASSTQLDSGSMTYALDVAGDTANSTGAGDTIAGDTIAVAVPAEQQNTDADFMNGIRALSMSARQEPVPAPDENAIAAQFPEPVETEEVQVPVYSRPGLTVPDGYTGSAVTFDEDGNISVYGTPVVSMTAKTTAGTPDPTAAFADEYFSDAVFVGNSLVVGLQKSGLVPADFYANIGLSVRQFFEKPFLPSPDGETTSNGSPVLVTAAEALARDDSFRKVYLMFGINELGWTDIDTFISYYETIIDTILTIRPDAVIYVQAILPINETVYSATEGAADYYTNDRIALFNMEIAVMAARKQVVFLTPGEAVMGEDGQLAANATSDGIHLSASYLGRWKTYLAEHTAEDVDLSVFYEEDAT